MSKTINITGQFSMAVFDQFSMAVYTDGIPKLDEEIRKVFPRADFQLCTIHASRNFESEVREYDVNAVDSQLKQIFLSEDREEGHEEIQ